MGFCEFLSWLGGGGAIATGVGFMLTRPRLINPTRGQKNVDMHILETSDIAQSSTSVSLNLSHEAVMRGVRKITPHTFIYVTLENKPYVLFNSTARGVSAEVRCVGRTSGNEISYFARPMDTPAPGKGEPGYGSYQASRVDIPPGKPLRGFYVAFCVPGEEKFYGFSKDSYTKFTTRHGDKRQYYDLKNPALEMGGELYNVVVTFSGENFKPFDYNFPMRLRTKNN